jgi:HlyD family secretion protein
VKGVIVDRRVNIGQTVVASLNAPSLFLIAKDLRRMQVWASVNEADIGKIHAGLPVSFTVDTWPNEVFRGTVNQIRFNATMTQNVVTYTVVIDTDNSNLKLYPYLTANVNFEVEKHPDVLMVPNAALRWTPKPTQVAPDVRAKVLPLLTGRGGGREGANGGKTPGGAAKGGAGPDAKDVAHGRTKIVDADGSAPASAPVAAAKPARQERGRIWVKDEAYVRPVEVRLGVSDGSNTEISLAPHREEKDDAAAAPPKLEEGTEVVVGEEVAIDTGDVTNPFAPKFFGKGGGKKL